MKTQIPIYRAKKIDSDEHVKGWYSDPIIIEGKLYLSITNKDGVFRIDPSTLAIHFPDMIDSEGTKIFASLSEDGKGGDNLLCDKEEGIAKLRNGTLSFVGINGSLYGVSHYKNYLKVTGMQQ